VTIRQQDMRNASPGQPYTPEMVINGAVEFNGSDGAVPSLRLQGLGPCQSGAAPGVGGPRVEVQIDGAHKGDQVFLALADDSASTAVTGGKTREPIASRGGVP